ncbi:unnamed protein product [Alternaria burnsii]|nr:unnamed protein product [Alternaria burnsii]
MKFTFKPFKDHVDSRNPGQRRREQVRRAQKTHRERKEAYTASLESEVVQLRANEARLSQEAKTLYSEVTFLKILLTENGIAIPERPEVTHGGARGGNVEKEKTIALTIGQENKRKNRRKQIYVQQMPREPPSNPPQLITPPLSGSTGSGYTSSTFPDSSTICMGSLDPEIVGMDFVLTLESPCLPHIDVASPHSSSSDTDPPTSTGHALTVSACLFHHHPSPPGQRQLSPATWEVPHASIDQLLALSGSVPLQDGEVTPVQAWDYVRRQEQFTGLEAGRWESLKLSLTSLVQCHGFGGVIERSAFENAVFEAFIVGRVF